MYDCLNIHKTHSLCYLNLYSNHLTHALNNMYEFILLHQVHLIITKKTH